MFRVGQMRREECRTGQIWWSAGQICRARQMSHGRDSLSLSLSLSLSFSVRVSFSWLGKPWLVIVGIWKMMCKGNFFVRLEPEWMSCWDFFSTFAKPLLFLLPFLWNHQCHLGLPVKFSLMTTMFFQGPTLVLIWCFVKLTWQFNLTIYNSSSDLKMGKRAGWQINLSSQLDKLTKLSSGTSYRKRNLSPTKIWRRNLSPTKIWRRLARWRRY